MVFDPFRSLSNTMIAYRTLKMDKMDPRRTIGATVHTKAMHNTSEAECIRRYGSNNKTKLLKGKVLSFDIILKEG